MKDQGFNETDINPPAELVVEPAAVIYDGKACRAYSRNKRIQGRCPS